MHRHIILVGIGSPNGDDEVGWLVAERVADRLAGVVNTRCLRTPAQLLDCLEGVTQLGICDAMVAPSPGGSWSHWIWPTPEIETAPFAGTHDLSLAEVLALAHELGRLPVRVDIWGIAVQSVTPGSILSAPVALALSEIEDEICNVLCRCS